MELKMKVYLLADKDGKNITAHSSFDEVFELLYSEVIPCAHCDAGRTPFNEEGDVIPEKEHLMWSDIDEDRMEEIVESNYGEFILITSGGYEVAQICCCK